MNPSDLSIRIDLSKVEPGKQTFLVTEENIRLPKKVKLLDVVPASVELNLAEFIEREVTIRPQLLGKLPGGLKIASIEVKPEKVKVLSPTTDKSGTLPSILTTPIYLESIEGDAVIYGKIVAPPAVQPVEKRWPDVEVSIKIRR